MKQAGDFKYLESSGNRASNFSSSFFVFNLNLPQAVKKMGRAVPSSGQAMAS